MKFIEINYKGDNVMRINLKSIMYYEKRTQKLGGIDTGTKECLIFLKGGYHIECDIKYFEMIKKECDML